MMESTHQTDECKAAIITLACHAGIDLAIKEGSSELEACEETLIACRIAGLLSWDKPNEDRA